jgi:hypothetical protein
MLNILFRFLLYISFSLTRLGDFERHAKEVQKQERVLKEKARKEEEKQIEEKRKANLQKHYVDFMDEGKMETNKGARDLEDDFM